MLPETTPTLAPNPTIQNRRRRRHRHGYGYGYGYGRIHHDANTTKQLYRFTSTSTSSGVYNRKLRISSGFAFKSNSANISIMMYGWMVWSTVDGYS
mmetsp:Transcript_705/g.1089  ORF Transcript_705/g.1089 Transcript_705/m.1089 type:complete len:96 (-) Transcript_705:65-352(-)